MSTLSKPDLQFEQRLSRRLLDVFIRIGLAFVLVVLCYRIFSPFIPVMAWALILAVMLYPAHQKLARSMGGKQGLAAAVVVLGGIVLIVLPTAILMASVGNSVYEFVVSIRSNALKIPAPSPTVADWPLVGRKIHDLWSEAYQDLPTLIQSMQPQIRDLAEKALRTVASITGTMLLFLLAFVVAGIIMAFGKSGAVGARSLFSRIVGVEHGEEFTRLSTATIRSVALGVLGIAFIQAIVIGLILIMAKVPFAGLLALLVLLLGIVQIPSLLVTLPVIAYLWSSGNYSSAGALTWSVLLFVGGLLDNALKPLLLGRGVDAPMPVILLGALGGLASGSILGMFVGATFLALGYKVLMWWVDTNPDIVEVEAAVPESNTSD